MVKNNRRGSRVVYLLGTVFALLAMSGCEQVLTVDSSAETSLEGYWIRTSATNRNAVIQVRKSSQGDYAAVLLWAPISMSQYGFTPGDRKWKNVVATGIDESEFTGLDLIKYDGGGYEYEDSTIVMLSPDRILEQGSNSKSYYQRIKPDDPAMGYVDYGYARIAIDRERTSTALKAFERLNRRRINDPDLLNEGAWTLATSQNQRLRSPKLAVRMAQQACELTDKENAMFLDTLAAAYALSGDFEKAVATQKSALNELETLHSESDSVTLSWVLTHFDNLFAPTVVYFQNKPEFQERLQLYQEEKIYLE